MRENERKREREGGGEEREEEKREKAHSKINNTQLLHYVGTHAGEMHNLMNLFDEQ